MARLRIYKNVFEKDYEDFTYDLSKSITENLEAHEQGDYSEMVECYDPETGETFFAPFLDDEADCAVVLVNGTSVSADYKVQENDEVNVWYMPQSGWVEESQGIGPGALAGIIVGGFLLGVLTGGAGWAISVGAIVGGILGGFAGWKVYDTLHQTSTIKDNSKRNNLPDVRGSSNQSLVNNPYPFVIGEHLTTPQIVGDPYTEYSGPKGEDAYIRAVYCVGSAPLKLTDFKLGDIMLAYNRTQGIERPVVMSGLLKGYSEAGADADTGDILDIWRNNDIELEIIQQPNGEDINYGHIYPDKKTESEINASVLYINDKQLTETAKVTYKGATFPDKFRTNGVWFTESYPMEFTINLDAQNGLYASRSKTTKSGNNTTTETEYTSIPLWYAIQWRPYDKGNASSDPNGNDNGGTNETGHNWHNITVWNRDDKGDTYNSSKMSDDKNAHKGNTIDYDNVKWRNRSAALSATQLIIQETGNQKTESDLDVSIYQIGSPTKGIYIGDKKIYTGWDLSNRYITGKINAGDSKDNSVFDSEEGILYIDAYNEPSSTLSLCAEWMDEFEYYTVPLIQQSITLYDSFINDKSDRSSRTVTVTKIAVLKKYFIGMETTKQSISGAWIDRTLTNFQSFSGEDGQSQMRFSATVTLTKEQCKQMLDEYNSIHGIEVRVIRVSPNYLNQTSSTEENRGAYSYSDMITVSSIVTKSFNRSKLEDEDILEPVKIQSEADMRRNVYIAIKAKADVSGNIQNNLEQLSCISHSLSPTWDKTNKEWLPRNVKRVDNYWGYVTVDTTPAATLPEGAPEDIDTEIYVYESDDGYKRVVDSSYPNRPDCYELYGTLDDGVSIYSVTKTNRTNTSVEIEVDQKTYESARQEGYNWYREKAGSNYQTIIKDEAFSEEEERHELPCWYLKDSAQGYLDSNAASSFMLCAIGPQNGPVAYGYENINLLAAGEWYEDCEAVKDGSVDSEGNDVSVRMEANGYVTSSQKLEQLLSEIAAAGRAVYTYDEAGKISPVMDKPASYPAGVINEQNIITESNAFSYAESPAGLRIEFSDENDGYEQNSFYCWADGNSLENYHGQVENYGFKYITNPRQAWSLGRYLLACRIQQKEAITVKIGREGRLFPILSTVLVQSNELLIGNGSGRIRQIIENNGVIYGFYIDSTFDFDGETVTVSGQEVSKMGVTVFQPKEYGDSRCVTLRLKKAGVIVRVNEVDYEMKVGTTNLVLLDEPVTRTAGTDHSVSSSTKYRFQLGDIAMFGVLEKISARYKVAKIKPESKGQYTEVLYPYDDSLYSYGDKLPSFQTYMTIPPVKSPFYDLKETSTTISDELEQQNQILNAIPDIAPEVIEISADKNGITIATDRDKKTICQQSFDINITCTKNDEPHGFIIGQITVPQGWTYTASASEGKVTFNVPKELYISGGNIEIPVIYDDTITYNGYVDQNGNPIVDEGNDSYDTTLWEEEPTEVLSVIYVSNDGGKNLGIQNATEEIPESPNLNDFFVWGGIDNASYEYCSDGNLKTGRIYKYVGLHTTSERDWYWETDEDPTHCTTAMADVFQVANSVLENNNLFAFDYIHNLAASTIFTNFLVANQAFISKLATDIITVGNPLYAATKQKQDGIAQNLGYANYEDMVEKAIEDGTIINGGYLRTSLIELATLFAEKIQLRSKTVEGVEEPGAIFGGKYLPNGEVNPESQDFKGVYLDSSGDFKCTNGLFEGDIKSSNYTAGMLKYYVDYLFSNTPDPQQIDTDLYSTPEEAMAAVPSDPYVVIIYKGIQIIDSDGIKLTTMYFDEAGAENPKINYYQTSDSSSYSAGGTWTQITWSSGVPNNSKKYIHFKIHDENTPEDVYYSIRSDYDQKGYVLKSDGNTFFNGDMIVKGNQYLSGTLEVTNSKSIGSDFIGIHSDNYNKNNCEGYNIAQAGNDSIFRVENVTAKSVSAWKPSNKTFSTLGLSGNKVSCNGFLTFTDIKKISATSFSSDLYNTLKDIYDRVGSEYLHCTAFLKWTDYTNPSSSFVSTQTYQYIKLTYNNNTVTITFGNYVGTGKVVDVSTSTWSIQDGSSLSVNEIRMVLFGYA